MNAGRSELADERAHSRPTGRHPFERYLVRTLNSLYLCSFARSLRCRGGQSGDVFQYQGTDFMKDVIASVDQLLNMGLQVHVRLRTYFNRDSGCGFRSMLLPCSACLLACS
jgi:hypothetical protein